MLGEVRTPPADLMETIEPFFVALYGQLPGISMESARFTLLIKKKKSPTIMILPPTSINLLIRVLRAYLQVMLWKVADQQVPPLSPPISLNVGGRSIKHLRSCHCYG